MVKIARKPSNDPVQEKLRQNKALFNKEVSAFINDLIHFKKLMNGWPSKFYKERSRIIEPIPADPATIIGSLVGDFQDIANKSHSLIQEQVNYAKNRRQKQPKQPGVLSQPTSPGAQPPPNAPAQELSKQLELGLAADDNYLLISRASNPLTRFWARLLNPMIGSSEAARMRRYRMSLLDASIKMYRDLKKMQSVIVDSGPQSIFTASKLLDKAEDNFVFLISGFKTFVSTLPQGVADAGAKIDLPSSVKEETQTAISQEQSDKKALTDPQVNEVLEAIKDIQAHINEYRNIDGVGQLIIMAKNFYVANSAIKLQTASAFLDTYHQILAKVSAAKNIPTQNSFAEIAALQTKSATDAQYQIQVLAQAFMKKLYRQLAPSDKTSAFRLDIYNLISENKKLLNKMMDILEDGFDQNKLEEVFINLNTNMLKIRTLMQALNATIRGIGYQPQFLNLLEKGRLGDYGVDLSSKQKSDLAKFLERKQMQDLVKMYGR